MKIIAFTQLRNELSKGNLENWFKQMSVCDYIYIYDQNSDDGSKEYYKKFDNCFVIESPTNRFKEELICKQELLNKLLSDHPDVDWILWIDGDLMLDGRLLADNGKELREICRLGSIHKIDAYYFVHYNLWRSDIFYRTDDSYHAINNYGGWRPLWRNNGNLHFDNVGGLHHEQYPNGLQKVVPSPFAVVHRGFATDYQIMTKYDVYKENGQNGWSLERLLDEHALEVVELDRELLPDWFEVTDDINPINKRKLREIYDESKIIQPKIKKNVEVISLIFKSIDYLDLIYNEMKSGKSNVDGWDITFRIVANDATPEIIEKLKSLDIPHTIYNDPKPNDYYLNRVYRCWNYAGQTSESDNICFVNSDMVFSDGWLTNLLKHHDGINIPCSRLVESGKLLSGLHAVSVNCGITPKEINYDEWNKCVNELSEPIIDNGGLFMPCVLEKKRFLESGMYPEGNIYNNGIGNLGNFVKSGDAYYFDDILSSRYGMKHVTIFDSLVYHIQEGEKDI
jgi:hypothetical protein